MESQQSKSRFLQIVGTKNDYKPEGTATKNSFISSKLAEAKNLGINHQIPSFANKHQRGRL